MVRFEVTQLQELLLFIWIRRSDPFCVDRNVCFESSLHSLSTVFSHSVALWYLSCGIGIIRVAIRCMTCAIYLRLYEKIFEPLCVWWVWLAICDLWVEIKQMNFSNKTPLSSGSVLEEIVVIPRMLTFSPDPAAHREILRIISNAESAPVILPGNFVTRTRQRIGHVESSRLSKEAFARLWANRVYNLIARHPAPSHPPWNIHRVPRLPLNP